MTYEFRNINYAKTMTNSNFWSYDNLDKFRKVFVFGNITVVESMRLIKTAYVDLMSEAIKGRKLFGKNKRWPQDEDELNDTIYFTDADSQVARILNNIASALDDRAPSVTRDQNMPIKSKENPNESEPANQNAFKQLSELRVSLNQVMVNPDLQWDRSRAEVRLSAVWK